MEKVIEIRDCKDNHYLNRHEIIWCIPLVRRLRRDRSIVGTSDAYCEYLRKDGILGVAVATLEEIPDYPD